MYSVVGPTLSAARNSPSRTMLSLPPGSIVQGARWNYRILNPVKGDNTHISTVFKADVVPLEDARSALKIPKWAFIKVASPSDAIAMQNLDRERQTYQLPVTLALEWLDTTLAEVKYLPDIRTYSLIMTFLRAVLTSRVLEDHKYIKPANILLSGIKTSRLTAKVGDLGLVVPAGRLFNAQPYSMRAPEVFLGQACTKLSQVWAIAAMLLCWIKPGTFGVRDSPHSLLNEAWSMAKINRLFPHWNIPTPDEVDRDILKAALDSANRFSDNDELSELQAILPLDREIQEIEMPQELRDLRLMLVVNPIGRPSASSVLASKEFRAFGEIMGV
ncbi:hypothetical protein BJX99DRAFT_269811 [Aspergillus californicus]